MKTAGYRYEIRRGDSTLIGELRADWQALSNENLESGPFTRPEWIEAMICSFLPKANLLVVLVWCDSQLRAVLPLQETKSNFLCFHRTKLKSPTTVHSNRFDIACGSDKEISLALVWKALTTLNWSVIELQDTVPGSAAHELQKIAITQSYPTGRWLSMLTPIIQLGGNPEKLECLGESKREFVKKLRKKFNKLKGKGNITLKVVTDYRDPALDEFYRIEGNGWKGKNGTAIICDKSTKHFYDQIAESLSQAGYFNLYCLYCNDEIIAANFALTMGTQHFVPKTAYKEEWSDYSPGQIIFRETVIDCVRRGLTIFDFLGPTAEWKRHWSTSEVPHYHLFFYTKGILGLAQLTFRFRILKLLRMLKRWLVKKLALHTIIL